MGIEFLMITTSKIKCRHVQHTSVHHSNRKIGLGNLAIKANQPWKSNHPWLVCNAKILLFVLTLILVHYGCLAVSQRVVGRNKASLLIDVAANTTVNQLFQHRPHLQWYEYRQWWSFGPPGNVSESHRQHCLSRDLLSIPLSYLIPLPALFEPRQQHHNINNTSGENQSCRSSRSICSSLWNNTTNTSLKTAQSSQHRGPNWARGYFYTYWQAHGERPEASCPSEC